MLRHSARHFSVSLVLLECGREEVRNFSSLRAMVSSHGRVQTRMGIIHWGTETIAGYRVTSIGGKSVGVHQHVARAFFGPPSFPKAEVNHKDFDRSNNHVGNLEYVTRSQNIQHSWDFNLQRKTSAVRLSKAVRARLLGSESWACFSSMKEAERILGVHAASIQRCCSGQRPRAGSYEFEYLPDAESDSYPDEEWSVALHPDSGEQLAPLQVSSHGRVKSKYGNVSHGSSTAYGYRSVSAVRNSESGRYRVFLYVHRLVARTFLGPPLHLDQWQVHHKDHNRNNNHIDNLEYVTQSENVRLSHRMNLDRGKSARTSSKPVWACHQSCDHWSWYPSVAGAARCTGMDPGNISACCRERVRRTGHYRFRWAETAEPPLLQGEEWREIPIVFLSRAFSR